MLVRLVKVTDGYRVDLSKSEVKSQVRLKIWSISCLGEEIKGRVELGLLGESCAQVDNDLAGKKQLGS